MEHKFKAVPTALRTQIRDEVRQWLRDNNRWSSAGGAASSAIIEWRLQEQGFSLWGKYAEPLVARRETGQIPCFDYPIDFNNRWVLRDANGEYVDHDQYRHDLADRHNTGTKIEFIEDYDSSTEENIVRVRSSYSGLLKPVGNNA